MVNKNSKSETSFHWSVASMFIGLFLGIFTFAFIGTATFVSKLFLSKFLAFFCFIGLLIPFRFYKNRLGMSGVEAILFNIMAIGPSVCSLLLWINFLFRTNISENIYNVISVKITNSVNFENTDVLFTLENDSIYDDYPEFRTMPLEKNNLKKAEAKKIKIIAAEGLLGYKVFLGNEVAE